MTVILFDDDSWADLLPIAYTRPTALLRCGIFTAQERVSRLMPDADIAYVAQDYLSTKYPSAYSESNVYINGKWIISDQDSTQILDLKSGAGLRQGDDLLAFVSDAELTTPEQIQQHAEHIQWTQIEDKQLIIHQLWDIFALCEDAIQSDWSWLTRDRNSQPIPPSCTVIGDPSSIFLEEGAVLEASILNPRNGKIYIAADAEVMPGSMITDSLAMLPHAVLKMGAKIYGATSLGPYCKVGGEVSNCVFQAFSNKGHDGFLGNSVIGEWCNFGADTNNSNLKNNYAEVKLWSESRSTFVRTGLQFCGLIMADHSKCGINTMFNTGTVVGVSCNIFGAGFPRNFVPSYSWGGNQGYMEYKLTKAFDTMKKMMERRGIELNEMDQQIYTHIYNQTQNQRNF